MRRYIMKLLYLVLLLIVVFTFNSCLTYYIVEYTVEFSDNFSQGKLTVIYSDIRSSHEEVEKREEDFKELINLYQSDKFLLDLVEEGVYVKGRELYEKDGMIYGKYWGIFEKAKIDGSQLEIQNDERIILMDLSPNDKIEANGKILRSDNNVMIVWPKDQKKLTIKKTIGDYDNIGYSIIDYYKEWASAN